jgi:hypothetical protein
MEIILINMMNNVNMKIIQMKTMNNVNMKIKLKYTEVSMIFRGFCTQYKIWLKEMSNII